MLKLISFDVLLKRPRVVIKCHWLLLSIYGAVNSTIYGPSSSFTPLPDDKIPLVSKLSASESEGCVTNKDMECPHSTPVVAITFVVIQRYLFKKRWDNRSGKWWKYKMALERTWRSQGILFWKQTSWSIPKHLPFVKRDVQLPREWLNNIIKHSIAYKKQ